MKYKIKPLFGQILIQREVGDKKTPGGLLLPAKAVDKLQETVCKRATVLAVGPGAWASTDGMESVIRVPMSVKEGDTILVPPFGGFSVDLFAEKEGLAIIDEKQVLGVVES